MKVSLLRILAVSLLAVCAGTPTFAQNQSAPSQNTPPEQQPAPPPGTEPASPDSATPAKPQFFAGTVTKLDAKHIIVSRTLVGKAPETRSFLIQATTKLSRAVRLKQRVTVRYQHLPEGDVALEVQVRQRAPRAS